MKSARPSPGHQLEPPRSEGTRSGIPVKTSMNRPVNEPTVPWIGLRIGQQGVCWIERSLKSVGGDGTSFGQA